MAARRERWWPAAIPQEHYGSRRPNARLEESPVTFDRLTEAEVAFIRERDGFYQATVGENGWPYVQFRGGPKGFLHAIDESTIAYADSRGNRQYISTGNLDADPRVSLILMDYPNRARLKIWARAEVRDAEQVPQLLDARRDPSYPAKIERAVVLHVEAFDWNCPQHIPQRFTLEELAESGYESSPR